MNKKRFLIIVLVLILSCLPACRLVGIPDGKGNTPPPGFEFADDYLVGFMAYCTILDKNGSQDYPATDINNSDALGVYLRREIEETTIGKIPVLIPSYSDAFDLLNFKTTNNGPAPDGGIDIEASFYFNSQLYGQILNIDGVYTTKENQYYTRHVESYMLSSYFEVSLGIKQSMSASIEATDGTVRQTGFNANIIINIKAVDYIVGARVIEFDKDHKPIKISALDLTDKDRVQINSTADCDYMIIEKDYMDYQSKQVYTDRTIIEKSEFAVFHDVFIPLESGLTKRKPITINFANLGEEDE